ncbi:MAG: bifunctional diaminohydroxyphosphoribosylaminopyrimidine deaminase/5-amino-6-(5-phosphoribosylamino)uracil reductase RibD [Acidimicrobiales bacterium]
MRVSDGPVSPDETREADSAHMARAIELGHGVRGTTSPNPWVGAVLVPPAETSELYEGATAPPGGPHAEIGALERARQNGQSNGATLYCTLEPCAHQGRTPPCTDAIIAAGVSRVVVGVHDPDPAVNGAGVAALAGAGIDVTVGVCAAQIREELAPYLKHRTTGVPWVVLKLALTMDGRIAAPDGTSKWITGDEARSDVQALRALSDAIMVGAGTVRADDPSLRVRGGDRAPGSQPMRVVLGRAPSGAAVAPAVELEGDIAKILLELGSRGVLQVLVEGGAKVAHQLHSARLVDRYVLYLAPLLAGGNDASPAFLGPGDPTLGEMWRGRLVSVERLGNDVRVELAA